MTTRSQVKDAINGAESIISTGLVDIDTIRNTLQVLVLAANAARYRSPAGKPVESPVYESPSDVVEEG